MGAWSVDYWLGKLEGQLSEDELTPKAVRRQLRVARHFLHHFQKRKRGIQSIKPSDLQRYLYRLWRRYRRRHSPPAAYAMVWRSHYTGALHRLLRLAQGQWPPPSPDDPIMEAFASDLGRRGLHLPAIRRYRFHARFFLEFLHDHKLEIGCVTRDDVAAYFRVALRTYQRRRPGLPHSKSCWRKTTKWAVQSLLRFVQGEWPPRSTPPASWLRFKDHLEKSGYCKQIIRHHLVVARQFLDYLGEQSIPLGSAGVTEVDDFIRRRLARYRKREGRLPGNIGGWRASYTAPLHGILRLANPRWYVTEPPADAGARFRVQVCEAYKQWLTDVRGLSEATLLRNGPEVQTFLRRLGDHLNPESLRRLSVVDIDAYLSWRLPTLRRASRYDVCQILRSLLRYLYAARLVGRDLSGEVRGPILYHNDEIRRAFTQEQVTSLLAVTSRDQSAKGRRDRAILSLLATYGLRAGEVTHLRLDDIDWRADRVRIRHSKTRVESDLPLVPAVGEPLLEYLQRGRPQTHWREVFLRTRAPMGPLKTAGSLHGVIKSRMKQAGIVAQGKHGAHAFRFARARSLLQASVPLKSISDLFGHMRTASTETYLRLAINNLRAISLDIPGAPIHANLGR